MTTDQQTGTTPTATPLSRMRKAIARRLQMSKQEAPHFRAHIDAEMDALLALRKRLNAANPDAGVSVNDLLIKAAAVALQKNPRVNVQFDGEAITPCASCDISVAVAIDDGLITPIVRYADSKSVAEIATAMRDLAARARDGKLKADEYLGGTFTISNLGMYGIRAFDAIINPPQVAILAVGAASQQPVVHDGEVRVATVMNLTLSSDHRVVDGAVAAAFLASLKAVLEAPEEAFG